MGVRVALVAVAAAVAVSGCSGGDPSPTPVPSGPASPTVSSSPPSNPPSSAATTPTQSPPALPADAREDSPAGAESFARYWIAALDYAYRSGDTQPFLAAGRCKSCKSLADGIDQFYGAGGRFEGGAFTVSDAQVSRHVAGSGALVDLIYSRAAASAIPASGDPKPVAAEKDVEFLLTLSRAGQSWQLSVVKTVNRK